jgi:hypothetical protein
MRTEFPTAKLICNIRLEVKVGLDQLIEKKSQEERWKSPQSRFVNEALLLLLAKEGIAVNSNSSGPVLKKPPSAAMRRMAVGS